MLFDLPRNIMAAAEPYLVVSGCENEVADADCSCRR